MKLCGPCREIHTRTQLHTPCVIIGASLKEDWLSSPTQSWSSAREPQILAIGGGTLVLT